MFLGPATLYTHRILLRCLQADWCPTYLCQESRNVGEKIKYLFKENLWHLTTSKLFWSPVEREKRQPHTNAAQANQTISLMFTWAEKAIACSNMQTTLSWSPTFSASLARQIQYIACRNALGQLCWMSSRVNTTSSCLSSKFYGK